MNHLADTLGAEEEDIVSVSIRPGVVGMFSTATITSEDMAHNGYGRHQDAGRHQKQTCRGDGFRSCKVP